MQQGGEKSSVCTQSDTPMLLSTYSAWSRWDGIAWLRISRVPVPCLPRRRCLTTRGLGELGR